MSAVIESHKFRYVWKGFILKGHVGLKLKDIAVEFGVKAEMTTLPDGRQIPFYEVIDVKTHITRKNVGIIAGGGFVLDGLKLVAWMGDGIIAKKLTAAITAALEEQLPKALNIIPH